jgi:hypothetical protein
VKRINAFSLVFQQPARGGLPCAAGYNIKWLLRMIRKKGIRHSLSLPQAIEDKIQGIL